jgi:hypothetical protein
VDVSDSDVYDDAEEIEENIICDKYGNVVCRYKWLNEEVAQVYQSTDGLPITVYTEQDYRKQDKFLQCINIAIVFVYLVEIIAAVAVYLKKRVKK